MCLAIYKPKNETIPLIRLRAAQEANPDGYGLLWPFDSTRGIGCFNEFLERYYEHERDDLIIHFRTASSGSKGLDKCHPFYVNDNLAFVENGNLFQYTDYFGFGRFDTNTDIQRFNDEVLKRLPDNFLYIREIMSDFGSYCLSNMTKIIFMDATGRVYVINEKAGQWVDGVWYSNGGINNYVGYGYSGAYYYNQEDTRHKGGLLSVGMFPDEEKAKWGKCPSCLGYFKDIDGECDDCKIWKNLLRWRKN
jgi:hypothetical protein